MRNHPHTRGGRTMLITGAVALIVLVAVVAVILLSRNGSDGEDRADAPPRTILVHGLPVPNRDLPQFGQTAFIRSLDPCGFLDRGELSKFGMLTDLEPDSINSCRSTVENAPGFNREVAVLVDLHANDPRPESSSNREVTTSTVAGLPITREYSGGSDCTDYVPVLPPLDPRFTPQHDVPGIERPPSPVWIALRVAGVDDGRRVCTVTDAVVQSVARQVSQGKFPLRTPTTPMPLFTKDPCEVVDDLPAGEKAAQWAPTSEPRAISCSINTTTPNTGAHHVDIIYAAETEDSMTQARDESTSSKIDGRTLFTFSTATSRGCTVTTTVGEPVTVPSVIDGADPITLTGTVTAKAQCDIAQAFLLAAVAKAES